MSHGVYLPAQHGSASPFVPPSGAGSWPAKVTDTTDQRLSANN